MVRSLIASLAAALALATAVSAADAQTVRRAPRHAQAHYTAGPGDVVVHAGRSYLDPGVGASPGEWGTGNRYVGDTTPYSFAQMGPPHAFGSQGFEALPRLFDPPGLPEPIAEFW